MNYQSMNIGKFCKTGSGGTPSRKKLDRYYGGGIPWVKSGELREGTIFKTEETITDIALKETSAKLIPANALLVAMYGATIGRVAVLGIEATSNQAICHIVPDDEVADRRYLFYALRHNVPVWINRGVGGAQPNISQQIIRNTPIPLPPLEEQKRIAAILDKAGAVRRKRKEAIALTEELLRSTFLDMFGDPGENPHKFETGCLTKMCSKVTDGTHHMPKPQEFGVPILRALNIKNDSIEKYDLVYISEKEHTRISKRSPLEKGDVLLTCLGTIGNVAIFEEKEQFSLVRNISLIKPNYQKATSEFLQFLLITKYLQAQMKARARQSSQAALYIGEIEKLDIFFPPIRLQKEFSDFCKHTKKILLLHHKNYKEQQNLFNSLLQKAFRGEL